MPEPLNILLVEDHASDAELVLRELRRAGFEPVWERVQTKEEYCAKLRPDLQIILSDYAMPQFDGLTALKLLGERGLDIPFIIVSGTIGEETAVAAMKQGAVDYLLKDRLGRLGPAVIQALEQHRLRKERLRADEALRKANAHLYHLVARSPTVIYTRHASVQDAFLNYVSANVFELLGFRAEEIVRPEWWSRHLHPDDRAVDQTGLQQAMEQGRSRVECRIECKDGSYLWVEDRKRYLPGLNGEPAEIVGGWTDITARKHAEEAQREAETKYRRIFENAVEGIYQATADGRLLTANPALARMAGYASPEEVITDVARIDEQFYADDAQRAEMQRLLREQGFVKGFEARMRRKDGSLIWISSNAQVVRDPAGSVYCEGTMQDITERKLLEEKFLRAQRMEAVGTLASGVSHDLNNILAPVLLAAGLLKDTVTDPQDREMLLMVERSAQRGTRIISQLLAFSRGVEGARVSVQLRHLFREMTSIMQETFPRNIQIESSAPGDLWPVVADATQLHQVLMNLCVNARDAMPEGGRLGLKAENIQLDEKRVRVHPEAKLGDYVMVTVSDTGTGIPPEIISSIFDPFFTTKEIGKGTGLGLSTVIGIVKSHEGFITVDSKVNQGTVFKVYLPVRSTVTVLERETTVSAAPFGGQELVLVVDDEEHILSTTKRVLEKHHYQVLVAGTGEEALRVFAENAGAVKLVLTDMIMPGMGGVKLIRALRTLQPDIKVIACSGFDHEEKKNELADLGIKETLAKPFTPAQLLKKLRRVLAG